MNLNFEILQYFVMKKIVKRKDFDYILSEIERLNMPVETYLTIKEMCTETQAYEVLADFYNIPFVEVDMLDFDEELLALFTYEFMKKNKFLPVTIDKNGALLICTGAILDPNALSTVAVAFNGKVDYVLTPPSHIDRYIDSILAVIQTSAALVDLNNAKDEETFKKVLGQEIRTNALNRDEEVINNPSVRLVDSIIKEAIPYRASDIHIEPFEKVLKVRYRIDGDLQSRADIPIESYPAICARIKIMSGMNIAETRKAQDGRINAQILGRNIDFRVSSQPTVDGENIVMRILDEKQSILDLDKLGYFPRTQNIIKKCIQRPEGIVIITGPTGSGKTTTLYTVLSMINSIEKNIMTLENPVEYRIPLIRQTSINPEIGVDFADGIRTLMRQDPDVILVGEIRDRETAIAAVQAAMTGHQVFSSLHTNDAFSAIPRLMQIGVEPYLLSGSLICVIAQRLARKLCPHCRRKRPVTEQEKTIISRILGEKIASKVTELYEAVGCEKCRGNGFTGRMAIVEIIDVDKELDEMIVRRATKKEMTQYLNNNGFISMQIDGVQKVVMGYTTMDELMRVVDLTSVLDVK